MTKIVTVPTKPERRKRDRTKPANIYAPLDVHTPEYVADYAKRLAVTLWEKHYKHEAPHWKPLPDLFGILTQISNMTAGLARAQELDPK